METIQVHHGICDVDIMLEVGTTIGPSLTSRNAISPLFLPGVSNAPIVGDLTVVVWPGGTPTGISWLKAHNHPDGGSIASKQLTCTACHIGKIARSAHTRTVHYTEPGVILCADVISAPTDCY